MWTCNGSWPNGMKLTSTLLLYQLLTQYVPGCDHEREALGAPFLDARLHPMGADGINDQAHVQGGVVRGSEFCSVATP
jgi:hypothetical protein